VFSPSGSKLPVPKRKPAPLPAESLAASFSKLRQLLSRRDKIGFGLLLLGMIGAAGFEVVSIGTVPVFVALAINPEPLLQYAPAAGLLDALGITDSRSLMLAGCAALLTLFLVKTLYMCLLLYAKVRYTQQRRRRLTERMFRAYMNAPYEFHLGRNSSELLRNTNHEVSAIFDGVLEPLLQLIMHGLMTLSLVVLLVVAEPLMALLAVLIMGAAGFGYQWRVRKQLKAYGTEAQRLRRATLQTVQQGLGSLKEARILRRESFFVKSLDESFRRMMRAERYSKLVGGITTPYMEFVAVAGLLSVTIVLVLLGRPMENVAPTLALFAAALVRLRSGIGGMVGSMTALRYKTVAIDPVYGDLKLLEWPAAPRVQQTSTPPRPAHVPLTGELALHGVCYRYPGAPDDALRDVSLTIPRGQAVAFVGPTGAGKTTIVDVILGLLRPRRGTVTVDGVDIHANLAAWHRSVGYIPQFIYLTDDTIRRNVALGLDDRSIDEAQVRRALEAAQLMEFVDRLPAGLDTVVGERGVRLSGGQRQRIGIARALYHNPDVLIMDEATSALDHATEQSVIDAVNALKGTRTILMIAHRLTTVRQCDVVYRMKDGRIEAVGTYDEIVGQTGAFHPVPT